MLRNEVRRLCEVVALTIVYDRILHEGAKRCEGTSTLYTVGCQGSLRAARPESVTFRLLYIALRRVTRLYTKFRLRGLIRLAASPLSQLRA